MQFLHAKNYEEMSKLVATVLLERVKQSTQIQICLPTGTSPKLAYQYFVEQITADQVEKMTLVKLDEWCGLPKNHKATCEWFLNEYFIQPLHISSDNFISMDATANIPSEMKRINQHLEKHPLDLCLLGFGNNGHLGLNEPALSLETHAHQMMLAESSTHHTMLNGEVVTHGITMGMKNLLDSKEIFLIMTGKEKKALYQTFLNGQVSTALPASFLWLHRNVIVFVNDEDFS